MAGQGEFEIRSMILTIALLLPATGLSQDLPDADTREVQSYVFTEAALAKYTQATRNLKGMRIGDCDDPAATLPLNEATAKLDASPGVKAAITSAGLTTREFVVFSYAIVHNVFGASAAGLQGGKLPPGVLQATADFYNNHAAAFKEFGENSGFGDCG